MPTASEVTSRDVSPRIRSLPSRPTDVLLMLGKTLWGPIFTPQTVVDFDDYLEKYQGFDVNSETAIQMRQFFLNGGRRAIVSRVVHVDGAGVPVSAAKASVQLDADASTVQTNGTVTGTATAPFALANGDTLIGDVDAVGNQTSTILATPATNATANAETYALVNGQILQFSVNFGTIQVVTFNTADFVAIGAATAEEVAQVINNQASGVKALVTGGGTTVTLQTDSEGSGANLNNFGGTANAILGFPVGSFPGTGNVAFVNSVTILELKAILEADWTNGGGVTVSDDGTGKIQIVAGTAGAAGSVQVDVTSTADDELGLDNLLHSGAAAVIVKTLEVEGKYEGGTIGNALSVDVAAATSGVAEEFDLLVYQSGSLIETHANLTMDSAAANYVEEVVNKDGASLLVGVTDLAAGGTVADRRPADIAAAALSGGDDGLALLDDNDFIGIVSGVGLSSFDTVTDGDILVIPDSTATAVQNLATNYCATTRRNTCVFVPDVPAGLDSDAAILHVQALTPSEQATALNWPRIVIPNPDKTVFGSANTIVVASSGSIAGRFSKNTQLYESNVFTQPGNEIYGRLENVVDVESDEVKRIGIRRKVTPERINPILAAKDTAGAFGVWLNDVQALKTDGNFKSIGEIRGMAVIRKAIMAYLETIRTTANTPANRQKDKVSIEAYMLQWVSRGVLASKNAADAFFVNTDIKGEGINNPLVQEAEEYKVLVSVATARARRFVEVLFTRDQRAVENFIQQQLNS